MNGPPSSPYKSSRISRRRSAKPSCLRRFKLSLHLLQALARLIECTPVAGTTCCRESERESQDDERARHGACSREVDQLRSLASSAKIRRQPPSVDRKYHF